MFNQVSVNSSAISTVGYNDETKALYITFRLGAEYIYPDVPQQEYINLISASSVGRYFNEHIKQYSAKPS